MTNKEEERIVNNVLKDPSFWADVVKSPALALALEAALTIKTKPVCNICQKRIYMPVQEYSFITTGHTKELIHKKCVLH
jgi:hypothetical protein